jgi:XrtN system VIT domain protein
MEDENTIVIDDAGIIIKKTQTGVQEVPDDQAPDHVARLFIYNNIMRTIGSDYLRGEINDDVVSKAVMGYVVTPVSSLIVLESQHDYERFDIGDTGDSLLNAARESSGAVPEPHEWALIVMFLLFVAFIKFRN